MRIATRNLCSELCRIEPRHSGRGEVRRERDFHLLNACLFYAKTRHWSVVAGYLPGRNGKQCRERWHNHVGPDIRKDRWSDEEDRIIIDAHHELGNR